MTIKLTGLFEDSKMSSYIKKKQEEFINKTSSTVKRKTSNIKKDVKEHIKQSLNSKVYQNTFKDYVYDKDKNKIPSAVIYSKTNFANTHEFGMTINAKNKGFLIPFLGNKKRNKNFFKNFKDMIDKLKKEDKLVFIRRGKSIILFAKNTNIKGKQINRFKQNQRLRTGAKQIKKDELIPIAVYVKKSIYIKKRTDFISLSKNKWMSIKDEVKKDFLSVF